MLHSILSRLLLAVVFNMLASGIANSAYIATYTYTGHSFDSIVDTNYYSINQSALSNVRIAFSVDDSLVPRNGHFSVPTVDLSAGHSGVVRSFYMTDGYRSVDGNQTDPYRRIKSYSIDFDTDMNGNVGDGWHITSNTGYYSPDGYSITTIESVYNSLTGEQGDSAHYHYSSFDRYYSNTRIDGDLIASVTGNQGTWSKSLTYYDAEALPIPGGALLFLSGLFGISLRGLLKNASLPWPRIA